MKAEILKAIIKTQEIERRRALMLMEEVTKLWKHNSPPEEYSHILEFEKIFKDKLNEKQK